ncbi:hypothetical protein EDD86DRAFT_90161 [Gorgonomyces haynaldii]|nr:hypothetical protein EDD86DRAFT_90161 [Gorgonomyces haynaldii]
MEKFVIENIQDPENSQTVTVKANIRQPANFVIANLSLDFGPCLVNQSNFNVQEIVISNPSQKHTRWFEVKVDPTDLVFEKCTGEVLFTLSNISEDTKKKMITQEAEDKIEQLHQKLKIAKTKGKLDKISKIQSEIDQLEQGSIETRQRSKTVGPRFKTTEHSIIFPIGPRTLETVKIHFRPKSSDKSHLQYEVCTMQLCVHEHKNIDVMKYVSLSAFVYYDQAQYDSVLKSFIRDTVDSDIFQDQPFSQAEESLTVEVSMVDLGRLEIGESKDCYLTLINKSSEEKSFVIQASKSNAYETQFQSNGIVKPNESLKFDLLLKPLMKGLQTCTLTVTESMKTNQVRFVFYGVHGQYFGFYKSMDLKEKLSDLDLGYCYVEPAKTFAMIRPIVIQNVTNDVIYCSAVSNLTQQCFIFVDHKLETQVNDILLHPHQPLVFYLGLQPNVSNKETKSGRELIGGIKFMASIKDPLVLNTTGLTKTVPLGSGLMPVHTHTLRFKAIIGQSIFSTSLQTIDFGTVSEMKDLHSGFWIQNQTSAMPMELQLRASGTCLKLGLKSIKTEDEKVHVPISFELKQFGYFEESIEILNLNNASNIINVNVRVFVDPQCLSVQVNGSHSRQHLTFSRVYVSQELEPVEDQEQVLLHVESKEEISLCLYSDLSLDISHSTDAVVDTQSVETQTVGAERELTLGNKQFHLMKQLRVKSTDLLVKLLPHKLLMDPTTTEKIQQGDCVSLCGSLMLYSQKVLKMLHVDLTCCLSKSTILNPVIDLGKVGYSNDWLKIPFSINGQNDADFGLCFQAETLDCIQIQSELECKTRSKFSFQCLFDPLHVERDAGPKSIQFRLLNTKSQETHLIQVKFIMTEMELKFERLQEDCLMLPTITIPDKNPQDNYFMITNTSDQDSKFEMQLEEVNPLVTVELVSRLWTSFSGGMVLLAPEAQTEIRVRVTPKPESRLLQEHVHLLEKCLVGYLNVYKSQKSIYRIGLKTLLIEGKTFQISPKTIEFQSMGSQDLLLTNLTMIPIRFKVSVEYPIELQNREILVVSPLNEDGVNILEDQFNLKIDLTNPSTDISETIKLNILDLDSIQKQPQTLNVLMKPKIQEIEKPVQMIELKGCKKILDLLDDQFYGLYELDLGQLDVSMTPHLKKIQLESKVGYDIKIVSHEQWLSCQRQESDKTSMILLTCSLLIRGSFSAYLIIKNLDMIDIKIIRIMLDVVAKPNARMLPPPVDSETLYQNVFDVYCTYDQPLLDMGDVCYGTDYVARSLVIYNRESVALQFSVKSNVQDSSEISFSLSRTAPRLFKTVQIPGQSFQKVYVRYWPGVSKTTEVQESQIHVDCRLVKDYRQTIQFKAICHPPQIQVSRTDFLFKANVTTTVGLEAESDTFTISNCFDEELVFEIASISTFFAIKQITSTDCLPVLPLLDKDSIQRSVFQSCSGHLLIPPKSSLQFKIVPIMDKLNENVEMIRKVMRLTTGTLLYETLCHLQQKTTL